MPVNLAWLRQMGSLLCCISCWLQVGGGSGSCRRERGWLGLVRSQPGMKGRLMCSLKDEWKMREAFKTQIKQVPRGLWFAIWAARFLQCEPWKAWRLLTSKEHCSWLPYDKIVRYGSAERPMSEDEAVEGQDWLVITTMQTTQPVMPRHSRTARAAAATLMTRKANWSTELKWSS